MNSKVKYWVEISTYDMETAEAMLQSKRYLYVGFMAHSHSLSLLAKKSNIYSSFSEEQKDFIDILEPLNIEARCPTHKQQLSDSLSLDRCSEILYNAKELQKWIIQKL